VCVNFGCNGSIHDASGRQVMELEREREFRMHACVHGEFNWISDAHIIFKSKEMLLIFCASLRKDSEGGRECPLGEGIEESRKRD